MGPSGRQLAGSARRILYENGTFDNTFSWKSIQI